MGFEISRLPSVCCTMPSDFFRSSAPLFPPAPAKASASHLRCFRVTRQGGGVPAGPWPEGYGTPSPHGTFTPGSPAVPCPPGSRGWGGLRQERLRVGRCCSFPEGGVSPRSTGSSCLYTCSREEPACEAGVTERRADDPRDRTVLLTTRRSQQQLCDLRGAAGGL